MTLEIEREAGWRDAVPGAYPSALTLTATDGPASPTRVHIANHHDINGIDYIWDYDDSSTSFSANLAAETTFDYFGQEADTPAVDDIMYFGADMETVLWKRTRGSMRSMRNACEAMGVAMCSWG